MNQEIKEFLRKFSEDVGAEDVSLFLFRDSSPDSPLELVSVAHHIKLKDLAVPQGMGIVGWVASRGEPVLSNDTEKDPRFSDAVDMISGYKTKSIIAVPVLYKDVVIGVIEVINKKGESNFTEKDFEITKNAANLIIKYIPDTKIKNLAERKK
ncbi:hypothetical protein DRQ09_04085 [candidate division KSB1 bacterium]|nr:MAG: hypothetical protein DRQ09_04085 [candidate division KSB1 bacterium]